MQASTVIPEPFKAQVDEAISEQVSNVEFGGGAELPDFIPPEIGEEIISISHDAVTRANRIALAFSACLTVLAFIASFTLPGGRKIQLEESLSAQPPK